MKPVILNKSDTCLTYALKRIGADGLLPLDYPEMMSGEHFQIFRYAQDRAQVADILVWDADMSRFAMANEISADGRLVYNLVVQGVHYAVCEEEGLISDCARNDFYPYIQIRRLAEVKPDWMLRRR